MMQISGRDSGIGEEKIMGKTIPQIDLSVMPENTPGHLQYLYELNTVDDRLGYLGHPDSVLLKNGDILTVYPEGHGHGKTCARVSRDGGKTYEPYLEKEPESWKYSLETPTIYRLEFTEHDWSDKLILISGQPLWEDPSVVSSGGFDCSLSSDEGKTWTEYEHFYRKGDTVWFYTTVAMSSLTKLKENGKFVDRWMGLFHTGDEFVNYKTILTFDEEGHMHWSCPEPYFQKYRAIEKFSHMCEVECIRSDGGQGDELLLLTRSNTKNINSLISISTDEGKTWSEPVEAPDAVNGERHKADYLPDGRLFITFRAIDRDSEKVAWYHPGQGYVCEGWTAWIGSYDDLKYGRSGDFRIKIAHTYLPEQQKPDVEANWDTGYCGNVVLPDGTVVTSSYGVFSPEEKKDGFYDTPRGRFTRKTYVASKRIRIEDVESLI